MNTLGLSVAGWRHSRKRGIGPHGNVCVADACIAPGVGGSCPSRFGNGLADSLRITDVPVRPR